MTTERKKHLKKLSNLKKRMVSKGKRKIYYAQNNLTIKYTKKTNL